MDPGHRPAGDGRAVGLRVCHEASRTGSVQYSTSQTASTAFREPILAFTRSGKQDWCSRGSTPRLRSPDRTDGHKLKCEPEGANR